MGDAPTFVWYSNSRVSPPSAMSELLPESAPPVPQLNTAEDNSIDLSNFDPLLVNFEDRLRRLRRLFEVLSQRGKQELIESLSQLLPSDSYMPLASLPVRTEIPTQPSHSRRLTIPSDVPSQASGPRGNKACRYQCQLCPELRSFSSLGTFKRHVTYSHYPKEQFLCFFSPQCGWLSSRRDKIHEHLRTRHSMSRRLSKQEIKDLGIPAIPPTSCPVCERAPFDSWDEFFRCFCSHCRLDDGSQSDSTHRDSNGSGGFEDGFGGGFFPSPSGDGPRYYNFPGGGDANNFMTGDTYTPSWNGSSYQCASRELTLASISEDRIGGEKSAAPQMMMKNIPHYRLSLGTLQLPITVPCLRPLSCPRQARRKTLSALTTRPVKSGFPLRAATHNTSRQRTESSSLVYLGKRNPTFRCTCACMALRRGSPSLVLDHSPFPLIRIPHPTFFLVIISELLGARFPRAWKEFNPIEHSYDFPEPIF